MRLLRTSICTLEPQVAQHAPEMFAVLSDPAIYEFEGKPPPSLEALARGYRKHEHRQSPDGEVLLNWVVRLPNGQLTGYVQATVPGTGLACIGYEFSSRFWRRGIATASVSAMLLELAATYQVDRFVAVLKSANFRSISLLRKLGFAEGTPDECAQHEAAADEVVLLSHQSRALRTGRCQPPAIVL